MKKESVLIICLFLGNSFTKTPVNKVAVSDFNNSTKLITTRSGNTNGPCPQFKELSTNVGGTAVCAYIWDALGDDWAINACNGNQYYVLDGTVQPSTGYYPMGSYWVMPGCTFWLFQNGDWSGVRKAATAGLVTNNDFHYANPEGLHGPGAYKCSCDNSPLNCVPTDGWETIFAYDNTNSKVAVTLEYVKSVGTTHSVTVTKAISESITLKAEISASFEGLFSAGLSATSTTGFNWSDASTDTFSETTTFTETITLRPGKSVVIQQAVGTCGFSEVRTNLFQAVQES